MSSLSQPQPPLLSLNVRRTVDDIIQMDATDGQAVITQPLVQNKVKEEPSFQDHSIEVKAMHDILEQQCFSFVAFHNHIKDAREIQLKQMKQFQTRANFIQDRIRNLSTSLLAKVHELNHRIDLIQKTLSPKPIFRMLMPPNDFGRITGIDIIDDYIAITMATGDLAILKKDNFDIVTSFHLVENESLFMPLFIQRPNNNVGLFSISSSRRLFYSLPALTEPSQVFSNDIESYALADGSKNKQSFDLITGHFQFINFCLINSENPREISVNGTLKGIRGSVTHIVVDDDRESVYLITSKRYYYAISSSNRQIVMSMSFPTPLMQLSMTQMFIIISCAPNDIILAERNREKFNQLFKIEISDGLRRFLACDNCILIITKSQNIEKRELASPLEKLYICEKEAADYDPKEYIGVIYCIGTDIYLAHGNRLSYWS
ncbi:hypothetical protein M9Y10_017791 [Tritrichomonas musculus]|uniref:CNH domain-containing protein n=1 Tax=Tritrichomonas musculus TaxID=1915356 RepID=A0ABR2HUH7_9EUKA